MECHDPILYSPWGCKELDATERLSLSCRKPRKTKRAKIYFSLCWIYGEGNGNPLQCSCLENPRDREAWWAAVYGVAQSQTRLKWLSSSSSSCWIYSNTGGLIFMTRSYLLVKVWKSRETSTSASLTMLKPLTVWITTNCGKFYKRWEYQTTIPVSWETMRVKKQQLEPDMEQMTVQNWERSATRLHIVNLLI